MPDFIIENIYEYLTCSSSTFEHNIKKLILDINNLEARQLILSEIQLAKAAQLEYHQAPYCSSCKAKKRSQCDCPPRAAND